MLAIPLGSYQPTGSAIHALDARVKAATLIVAMVCAFAITSPAQLAFALAGTALLVHLTRLGHAATLRGLIPVVPFALVVALFDLIANTGGTQLATLGPITITSAGAWAAVLYPTRLLMVVCVGSLLLATTTPTQLTDAFEALISPLARLGAPVHEIALVLSLGLRFVPILADEAQSVMDAQAARGASFEEGSAWARLRALGTILVPVFAGALRHAQNLARALDARNYEGGADRTHYHTPRLTSKDALFALATAAWLAVTLSL